MTSRRRMEIFQCTFFRLSPSCHARMSEGDAVSSDARARNSGPMSEAVSAMVSAGAGLGTTSTRIRSIFGRREIEKKPKMSRAEMRVTPASYTPRCGQGIRWRNDRAAKGGVCTLISCSGAKADGTLRCTRTDATGRSAEWRTVNTVISVSPRFTRGRTPFMSMRTVQTVQTAEISPNRSIAARTLNSR